MVRGLGGAGLGWVSQNHVFKKKIKIRVGFEGVLPKVGRASFYVKNTFPTPQIGVFI